MDVYIHVYTSSAHHGASAHPLCFYVNTRHVSASDDLLYSAQSVVYHTNICWVWL